ncbi:MAG TPA: hypothetical protein VKX17_02845 [Planctomycetota bacterium]|nr:hypothetical protein [Planctomycetota bacterium]
MSLKCIALFSCLSLFVHFSTRAEDMKPDADGFIHDWLLLAPIPIPEDQAGEEIDKQQIKDEAKLAPKEGDKTKINEKEFTWKKVHGKDYYFDINELLGSQNEDVICYAVCYVNSPDEQKDLVLAMGSNDQGKVYLNGKEIVKFTETRAIEKDQDEAKGVTLNKGVNTIVFKIANQKNNWQGALRFKTKAGAGVTGYTVKLAP